MPTPKTPQALNVSSGCGEFDGECGLLVEQRVVLEAVVELPEHAVEEIALGGSMPVSMVISASPVVDFGSW